MATKRGKLRRQTKAASCFGTGATTGIMAKAIVSFGLIEVIGNTVILIPPAINDE
jgi:hypothetical protein